ncbi:MAG: hypothetical protein Ct9H300mP28_13140 [Pseudomonadota bacterium]|nr:MAG: hypothetical protein Ct9H300mP28_13140 [Pseudomonadota bacterium]
MPHAPHPCTQLLWARNYLGGEKTDLMLAGAVSAADPFFVNMGFSIFQAYPEPDERSNPLDNNSGGLMPARGRNVRLKRLSDAERDGDRIHAVISGEACQMTDGVSLFSVPTQKVSSGF